MMRYWNNSKMDLREESRVLVFCRFLECLKLKEKERKETKRKGEKNQEGF